MRHRRPISFLTRLGFRTVTVRPNFRALSMRRPRQGCRSSVAAVRTCTLLDIYLSCKERSMSETNGVREAAKITNKKTVPTALKQAVWKRHFGNVFEHKCPVEWCPNTINVFNFHAGHNVAASRGGETSLENLAPICANCNLGMGDRFTIDEWSRAFTAQTHRRVLIVVQPDGTRRYRSPYFAS